MNAMVIYYSRTGSTEKTAKRIAKDFESPLLKVETDVLYGGFPSAHAHMVADHLQENLSKSVTETPDVSDCNALFPGFPIWWDDMPDYYKEFLGRLEADGKRLTSFTASNRLDMSRAIEDLRTPSPNVETRNPFHFGIMQHDDYVLQKRELSEDVTIKDTIH